EVDKCVVDDGGDWCAEMRGGLLGEGAQLLGVASVGLQGECAFGEGVGRLACGVRAGPVVDHHPGAFAQERLGDPGAESPSATGDEHHLVRERDGCWCGAGGFHSGSLSCEAKGSLGCAGTSTALGHPFASASWIRFDGCRLSRADARAPRVSVSEPTSYSCARLNAPGNPLFSWLRYAASWGRSGGGCG